MAITTKIFQLPQLRKRVRQAGAFALGTFGLAANAPSALAQGAPLPEVVVSAGQTPLESTRVGAAVTVIRGDDLRERGVPTVADALRSVPGVTIAQSGGRGTLTTVMIRGSDPRHVMVIIDGIEVNQLGFPGFDFADLPTDDIERIEVVRGPQSGIYGANAQSGVISIITRAGKGLSTPVGEFKIEGGSRNTLAGSANIRGSGGPFYGSMTITDYTTSGYNIARSGSERDGSRAQTFSAKGGIDFNQYINVEGVLRYTRRFAESDPQDFNFPPGPTYGLLVDGNAATRYENLASRFGTTVTLWDGHWIQNANVKSFDEHTRGLQDGATIFGADGNRTNVDYKSTFLFDTNLFGGERHSVTGFVDYRREDYTQLFDPTRYLKERRSLAGEYVLDLPTNTTLSGAVRQDWNSAFEDVQTWRFAVSQRLPQSGTRIHASIGKGVTDPDVFQLFGSTFNLANPALTPEQSVGWDAGVEQSFFDRRIVADITYFSTDFTDKIELTFDAVRGGFVYANGIGTARRRGVEFSSTFNLVDWLGVTATYTYTDAKTSAGDPEVRRPPHTASVDINARIPDTKIKASLGVVYNGVRKDFFFGPAGTTLLDLPGATVVRGQISYDITRWATAYVRAENVFDAKYEEIFSYRMPGFGAYAGLRIKLGGDDIASAALSGNTR